MAGGEGRKAQAEALGPSKIAPRVGLDCQERVIWLCLVAVASVMTGLLVQHSHSPSAWPSPATCAAPVIGRSLVFPTVAAMRHEKPVAGDMNDNVAMTNDEVHRAERDKTPYTLPHTERPPSSTDSESPALPRFGLMQMLWQTPVYRVSLGSFKRDLSMFNDVLSELILRQFFAFRDANSATTVLNGWQANGINQV